MTSTGGSGPESGEDHALDLSRLRLRLAWILAGILVILVLVFIPPLISVSRFQRRIASNLSASLGRPVHLDRVTLTLIPLPGFTLENFVVDEDPAFGYEPILRSNEVRATIRISSLWSRRVEFSRISLSDPTSFNLVRLPDGRWNFESVLLHASRIEAAPTTQTFAGPAPRFPYIESTGARINLKLGEDKIPVALTDSDVALWLPGPREWRFRLDTHPARTDVAPSDSGLLRIQGTLGDGKTRAARLGEVPIDLHAVWDTAPLAGVSRLALGRDAGIRGDLTVDLRAVGSVAHSALSARIGVARLRRSDFIPGRLFGFQASCQAEADNQFHSFRSVECHSPEPAVLIGTGSVPSVGDLQSSSGQLTAPALPASTVVSLLQVVTRQPPALSGPGVLAGTLAWNAAGQPGLSGNLELSGERLNLPKMATPVAVPLGDVLFRSIAAPAVPPRGKRGAAVEDVSSGSPFELLPVSLALGGKQPAVLTGHFDQTGYTVRLNGPALLDRVLALGESVPQLGDGLRKCLDPEESAAEPAGTTAPAPSGPSAKSGTAAELPVHLDLTATRVWGKGQSWSGCVSSHP